MKHKKHIKVITDLSQVPKGFVNTNTYSKKEASRLSTEINKMGLPALKLMRTLTDLRGPTFVDQKIADNSLAIMKGPRVVDGRIMRGQGRGQRVNKKAKKVLVAGILKNEITHHMANFPLESGIQEASSQAILSRLDRIAAAMERLVAIWS